MKLLPIVALSLIAVGSSIPAFAQDQDIAVVVNQNNHVSAVTQVELKKILLGEKRSWAVGLPIRIIVLPSGTAEHDALLKILGMSDREFKQYWLSLVFRGEVESEPTNVPSLGMQKEALSVFPGAITLVKAKEVKPDMKVLKVAGHLPGEPGYPIQ
ncbi:MAG TPA: hypothetical protein VGU90_08515 [Terriglobales bacterium]|nr:hypothetical protein [Terriglobales bacterium]